MGARRGRRGWRPWRVAALGAAAVVAACALAPPAPDEPAPSRAGRVAREAEMNHAWIDHTLDELLLALGPPWRLYDIPGGGNPPGFVVVYPRDPASCCLDAFALAYGPQTRVRAYLCR